MGAVQFFFCALQHNRLCKGDGSSMPITKTKGKRWYAMAKHMDDLFDDLFGDRRQTQKQPEIETPSARPARSMGEDLAQIEQLQQQSERQLAQHLADLRRMSAELDVSGIEAEVARDFGQSDSQNEVAYARGEQEEPKRADFSDLMPKLQEQIIGQDAFLQSLLIALKRPFIMGYDAPDGARNGILLWGSPSSGRRTALRTLLALLAEREILPAPDVHTMQLHLYPSQAEEKLFLHDLYMALQGPGSVVLFEGYEACHPALLGRLSELVSTGKMHLSSRYVLQKGRLIDASNALTPDAVAAITANGKYLVFLSEKGEHALAERFGATFVNALGDLCKTEPFDQESLCTIAAMQRAELDERAQQRLGFTLKWEGEWDAWMAALYQKDQGLSALCGFCDDCFRALSQYKLAHDEKDGTVPLFCEGEEVFVDFGQGRVSLFSFLPRSYQGQLAAVKAEVDAVIGLQPVKDYIDTLEDHYAVQRRRMEQGLRTAPVSMHMVFTGSPGTGKTTIARLVAKYLKAIGVLTGGQLIEVSRADLVGKYVGHTAPLTNQMIKSALGGVLFIDEAYALYRGKDDSFGLEAIDTLVKGMEDNRDNLLVILAGYEKEMEVFLGANSGLRSRFANFIHFPDYSGEELHKIALLIAKTKGYRLTNEAEAALLSYFLVIAAMEDSESGNGRLCRNLVERAILAQSKRIATQPDAPLDLLIEADFDLFE